MVYIMRMLLTRAGVVSVMSCVQGAKQALSA